MLFDFLFAQKPKAAFEGLKIISFDASLQENHVYQALVTKNPVETGADITDNVSLQPISLSMTGFISDTPVKFFQGIRNAISGSGSLSKTAHNDLVFLFEQKQPFTVVTGLETYENMILSRLSFPRNPKTGKAIRFECELSQITFANFETENLDDSDLGDELDSKEQATTEKDLGKQPAQPAKPPEVSAASKLFNFFFG